MDPQLTTLASFGWPHVAGLLGAMSMFLTFIGAIVFKYMDDKRDSSRPVTPVPAPVVQDVDAHSELGIQKERIGNLREKLKDMEELLRALAKDYNDIKVEVSSLKNEVEDINNKTYKDIEKLESKIDKLINMMIKLISDDKYSP